MRRTTTTTTAGVAVLAATLLLTGCTGGSGATPSTTPTTAPTASPTPMPDAGGDTTPTPTPTAAPVASIPTECTDIVDAQTYAATFGDTPLNPVEFGDGWGAVTPTTPADGATGYEVAKAVAELRCLWRDPRADVSGIGVDVGRVTADQADGIVRWAGSEGYTCGPLHEGTSCQLVTPDPQYPVETTNTLFVRDGVVVVVNQTNVPTDDLLGAISTRLWG